MTLELPSSWDKEKTYRSESNLELDNLPHLYGDKEEFDIVVSDTEQQLFKEDKRWSWKDIASVFPVNDGWATRPILRPRSAIHRHEYTIQASAKEAHQALIYAMEQYELMRCIGVQRENSRDKPETVNGAPLAESWYAILRTNAPGLFEQRIKHIEVDSLEDGMDGILTDDYNDGLRVQPPGALIFFTIVSSPKEPNKCGLLYQIHHSIFDMSSLSLFLDSMEDALYGRESNKIPCYGPYALWRLILLWTSLGKENVEFNAKRLSGISETAGKQAQWPEQRAEGWMRGNDHGWFGNDPSKRKPLGPVNEKQIGLYGDEYATHVEGIHRLRSEHSLSPAKVVKAAEILYNIWTTGAQEAIFLGAEGARMVKNVAPSSLDLTKVPGPVVEVSLTRFAVSKEEITLEFLKRVQKDQLDITAHCHCHRGHISSALSQQDSQFLTNLGGRQVFNWAPKVPSDKRTRIQLKKFEGRSDIGVSWVFKLSTLPGQEEILIVEASWDNCQMTPEEITLSTKRLLSAAKWLCHPENANKPIREFEFDPSTSYQYST